MRQALRRFCSGIQSLYKDSSLREPNESDCQRLLRDAQRVGWPGMLGSLDCSHYAWKNCPKAWAGQFQGAKGRPTVILEAVSDMRGRIWHAYFGMPGANNDINVLDSSNMLHGSIGVFVKTVPNAKSLREKAFQKAQESRPMDVERMFGMLQARWHVLTRPCELWDRSAMHHVVITCCVLHNMVIDDEMDDDSCDLEFLNDLQPDDPFVATGEIEHATLQSRIRAFVKLTDGVAHTKLLHDLVEHRWNLFGDISYK
ncbi:hypothetical protein H257_14792 [Aphanomyces astaci]|uniref:DDE Tnp4 domain-containing protein n=1 Tax=Aphanomyces astaci TaxID=112090 RepID=W4FRI9_APHAT|nr:hypothetical protein H257_14792 [Aphanomyces astaci]ETV69556.1 hypothetical protein H257_14792 [Aphanomyces astaci]|eukprot:XP_009840980.1 hypothetical protein H257_14792 [Aphanomyces astaci]